MVDKCQLCGSDKLKTLDAEAGVVKCVSCGFVFNKVRPTLEEIKAYYSKNDKYDMWLTDFEQREKLWNWRLAKVLKYSKKGSILDISAGIGQFLNKAKIHFDELAGTEVSKSAISIAKDKFNLDLLEGTIHEIDFKGRQFDNVTMFHVLEHVMDPKAEILKVRDLLVDGGRLFIAVPNDVINLKILVKKIVNTIKPRYKIYNQIVLDGLADEIHVSHFTPRVLEKLLLDCGFSIGESSLDKYFISTGSKQRLDELYFEIMSFVSEHLLINLYDTIWIVAKKV